jgi:hypothetical protein
VSPVTIKFPDTTTDQFTPVVASLALVPLAVLPLAVLPLWSGAEAVSCSHAAIMTEFDEERSALGQR